MLPIGALKDADVEQVVALAGRTGIFTGDELAVVRELVEIEVGKREQQDYHSFVARKNGQVLGFACYGPTPMTEGTYDLYWIFVDPKDHRKGVAGALLEKVEKAVRRARGRMLLADTSSSRPYLPARRFYQKHGFHKAAEVEDYYRVGDSRVTYVKQL